MEQAPKKGMSKGCVVALIVVGVIIILIAALGITCWIYKEDLVKKGTSALVESISTNVSDEALQGIDRDDFVAFTDAFVARMDSSDVDLEKLGIFMQNLQGMMADKEVDANEVQDLIDGMIAYYPELEDMRPVPAVPESENEEYPAETE